MHFKLYTDGSSLGNPGPGGFGGLLIWSDDEKKHKTVIKGGEGFTTNNRMEIMAVIKGLQKILAYKKLPNTGMVSRGAGRVNLALIRPHSLRSCVVDVFSDSTLVINTMTKNWKKKENLDLWNELLETVESLQEGGAELNWHWVKGHASHPENEYCDSVATTEAKKMQTKNKGAPCASFFCASCKKAAKGKLTKLPRGNLIRADCETCGKFIKFAKHTNANVARSEAKKQDSLF